MNMAKAVEHLIGRPIAGPMDPHIQLTDNGDGVEITLWDETALGMPMPTQLELEAAHAAALFADASTAYKELRRAEYPTVEDIADALFKKEAGDSTEWDAFAAQREEIKAKYPKP